MDKGDITVSIKIEYYSDLHYSDLKVKQILVTAGMLTVLNR